MSSNFTVVVAGLTPLAQALAGTGQFTQVLPVSSTGQLRDLLQSHVMSGGTADKVFFFADSTPVDTPQTLEFLIQRMTGMGARVVIVATSPAGKDLVASCPGAGLLEGALYLNTVLGALHSLGVPVSPVSEAANTQIDVLSSAPPAPAQPAQPAASAPAQPNPFAQASAPQSNPFAQPAPATQAPAPEPQPTPAPAANPFAQAPQPVQPVQPAQAPAPSEPAPAANPFAQAAQPPADAMPGNPFTAGPSTTTNPFAQATQPTTPAPTPAPTNAQPAPASNPFGAPSSPAAPPAPAAPAANPFGGAPAANPFGGSAEVPPAPASNPFGGAPATPAAPQQPPSDPFGGAPATGNPFGGAPFQPAQPPAGQPAPGGFPTQPGGFPGAQPGGFPGSAGGFGQDPTLAPPAATGGFGQDPRPVRRQDAAVAAPVQRRGYVITVTAPKGGTGKSTLSLNLAAYLGLRLQGTGRNVCIVDANVQQADTGKYLSSFSPNVEDILKNVAAIHPDRINDYLLHKPELNMSALLGPMTPDAANPMFFSGKRYKQIVDALRPNFDYIIVDTPVAELYHEMFREFAIPSANFILVAIAPNYTTLMNTDSWLRLVCAPKNANGMGVDKNNVGIVLNRAEDGVGFTEDEVLRDLGEWRFLGSVPETKEWKRCNNNGELVATKNYHELNEAFSAVLVQATGEEILQTTPVNLHSDSGLLGKLKGMFAKRGA